MPSHAFILSMIVRKGITREILSGEGCLWLSNTVSKKLHSGSFPMTSYPHVSPSMVLLPRLQHTFQNTLIVSFLEWKKTVPRHREPSLFQPYTASWLCVMEKLMSTVLVLVLFLAPEENFSDTFVFQVILFVRLKAINISSPIIFSWCNFGNLCIN